MRELKFRQPLFHRDKFNMWHYWGFKNGKEHGFTSPQNHQSPNYQFTGLLDKNGKEIYEGDVIRAEGMLDSEIIFEDGGFNLEGWDSGMNIKYQLDEDPVYGDYEVIGNIHENPELLTDPRKE